MQTSVVLRPIPRRLVIGLVSVLLLAGGLGWNSLRAHAYTGPGTYFSGYYSNNYGTRYYEGYVPSHYNGSALPLVVVLHGCTVTADQMRIATHFDQVAENNNFIVVFPQQDPYANSSLCWNWFLSQNQYRGQWEPSLIAGITQWVTQHYAVNSKSVYITGISAGGAMSSIMGAAYPDLYAAIGVHSGCEYQGSPCGINGGPDPVQKGHDAYNTMGSYARVLPTIVFQGDADTVVYPINGEQVIQQFISTDDWADDGSHNGSIPTTRSSTSNGQVPNGHSYSIDYYQNGHGAELMQRWLVNGMGHAWSGGSGEPYTDPLGPDASASMWSFFAAHPKP